MSRFQLCWSIYILKAKSSAKGASAVDLIFMCGNEAIKCLPQIITYVRGNEENNITEFQSVSVSPN